MYIGIFLSCPSLAIVSVYKTRKTSSNFSAVSIFVVCLITEVLNRELLLATPILPGCFFPLSSSCNILWSVQLRSLCERSLLLWFRTVYFYCFCSCVAHQSPHAVGQAASIKIFAVSAVLWLVNHSSLTVRYWYSMGMVGSATSWLPYLSRCVASSGVTVVPLLTLPPSPPLFLNSSFRSGQPIPRSSRCNQPSKY
jgi:hypothetical protein